MDKKSEIIKKIEKFREDASKEIPIEKVIFFGSRASGKPKKHSDIDLIVVSRKFMKMKFRKRPIKLYNYWKINYPVDFLCYTPEEFNRFKNQITIVNEAIKKGIKI